MANHHAANPNLDLRWLAAPPILPSFILDSSRRGEAELREGTEAWSGHAVFIYPVSFPIESATFWTPVVSSSTQFALSWVHALRVIALV